MEKYLESILWTMLLMLTVAVVITGTISLCIKIFEKQIYPTAKVEGNSMMPTLEHGEIITIKRPKQNYQRGDIVVFQTEGHYAIKRIIGLPGETVSVINDKIYIDGNKIEDYTDEIADDWGMLADGITLADNQYIVLGDNRDNSKDGTEYGAINESDIIGIVYP